MSYSKFGDLLNVVFIPMGSIRYWIAAYSVPQATTRAKRSTCTCSAQSYFARNLFDRCLETDSLSNRLKNCDRLCEREAFDQFEASAFNSRRREDGLMERFKTKIVRYSAGGYGRSAKWGWDVYEMRYQNLKVIGCGTTEDESSARDAATRAIATFLESEKWNTSRRRA